MLRKLFGATTPKHAAFYERETVTYQTRERECGRESREDEDDATRRCCFTAAVQRCCRLRRHLQSAELLQPDATLDVCFECSNVAGDAPLSLGWYQPAAVIGALRTFSREHSGAAMLFSGEARHSMGAHIIFFWEGGRRRVGWDWGQPTRGVRWRRDLRQGGLRRAQTAFLDSRNTCSGTIEQRFFFIQQDFEPRIKSFILPTLAALLTVTECLGAADAAREIWCTLFIVNHLYTN